MAPGKERVAMACSGRRRTALALAAAALSRAAGAAGCARQATTPPGRPFLLLELVRQAETAPGTVPAVVSACQWHVNTQGILYGDHWGWCEDYQLLPAGAPGYLLATTHYTGGTSGAYGSLHVLAALPAEVAVFGRRLSLARDGEGALALDFLGRALQLRAGQRASLGAEPDVLVEPPGDTGHFEPGGDQPVRAAVTYSAIYHGLLDATRIAGRSGG
jgi:hypothetical protein